MAASLYRRSFLSFKNSLFQIQKRTGYVVLIPETPEEITKCNIDSTENLPDFEKLTGAQCNLIVNSLGQQYDVGSWELKQLLKTLNNQDVFKYIFEPLEVLSVPYFSSWGVASALHYANYNLMPHNKFNSLSERILTTKNDKFQSKELYDACRSALENSSNNNYTEEQNRILHKFILEGHLNGFELDEYNRAIVVKLFTKMENQRSLYDEKLKVGKQLFRQIIYDKKFTEDAPLDLVRNTTSNAKAPMEGPWVLNLQTHTVGRYLEYCPSREARMHIWLSSNQLLSPRGDRRCSANTEVTTLLLTRQEYAELLGYKTYAHLAMKNKMADSVEHVKTVLEEILEPAKRAHEREINELEKFAFANYCRQPLEIWDFQYWKRIHLRDVYGIDEIVLRNYFPFNQVLLGLIALSEELFGISIEEESSVEGWNEDVRYFRIMDEKSKQIIGGFYLDPYSREGKIVGETDRGWFISIRSKSQICNSLPLSALIFNFIPPEEDKPSLLYLRDIENIFEKFGQMLQHTLTETRYSEVSGSSNVEWDFVGVARHFLCCWLQERGTLESISGHYQTGEPLPSRILDNLCNLKKHMAGTLLCRRIYHANLDLEIHTNPKEWKAHPKKLWPKHLLFQLHDLDQHVYSFQDIISGPWAASLYSEMWSLMLAADIYSAFEEAGFNNQEEMKNLGKRFRSTFLALGGGCNPKEVFRRFRGRDPDPKYVSKLLLNDIKKTEKEREPVLASHPKDIDGDPLINQP